MNKYDEKANRIREHLQSHPHDYQGVISLFKAESNSIMCEKTQKRNKEMAKIAKYRRLCNGKCT